MPATTRTITDTLYHMDSEGAPDPLNIWPNGRVRFWLTPGTYSDVGSHPADEIQVVSDEFGDYSVELWCNTLGESPTSYQCRLPTGDTFSFVLPPGAPITMSEVRQLYAAPTDGQYTYITQYIDAHLGGLSGDVAAANAAIAAHEADHANPHVTTAAQVGAYTQAETDTLVADETDARAAADTSEASTRAAAITSEATTRGNADAALQTNITAEAASRSSADTTLQANITAEASTRATADSTEATTRGTADTTLQGEIDTHAANHSNPHAVTALQTGAYTTAQTDTAIAAEATARGTAVAGEASARAAADTILQANITAEAATRAGADTTESAARAAHAARTDNPHAVTSDQVGALSELDWEGAYDVINDHFTAIDNRFGYYATSDFASLAAAITAIGSAKATLLIPSGTYTLTQDIPANIRVMVAAGATLTGGTSAHTIFGELIVYGLLTNTANILVDHYSPTVFEPRGFGAKGDDVADDTAAINACIAAAKLNESSFGISARLHFSRGRYKITDTLYFGSTSNSLACLRSVTSDGAFIHACCTGKAAVNYLGTQSKVIDGWLTIEGDATLTPTVGIVLGRPNGAGTFAISAGLSTYTHLRTTGYFSQHGMYKLSSEVDTFIVCTFRNMIGRTAACIASTNVDAIDPGAGQELNDVDEDNGLHQFVGCRFEHMGIWQNGTSWNGECTLDLVGAQGVSLIGCFFNWSANQSYPVPIIRIRQDIPNAGRVPNSITIADGLCHAQSAICVQFENQSQDIWINMWMSVKNTTGVGLYALAGAVIKGLKADLRVPVDLSLATGCYNGCKIQTTGTFLRLPPIYQGDVEIPSAYLANFVRPTTSMVGHVRIMDTGTDIQSIATFSVIPDGTTTPDVSSGRKFLINNSTTTVITDFLNGYTGQDVDFVFLDANTTIQIAGSTKIYGNGGLNYTGRVRDRMQLTRDSTGKWHALISAGTQPPTSISAFIWSGPLPTAVTTNVLPPGLYIGYAQHVSTLQIELGTAPTGSKASFVINRNGASIGTVDVLAGQTVGTLAVNVNLAAGDIIKPDITAWGSTVAGADARLDLIG